jgi:hypothetical protein
MIYSAALALLGVGSWFLPLSPDAWLLWPLLLAPILLLLPVVALILRRAGRLS